jgi:hypothetical protein
VLGVTKAASLAAGLNVLHNVLYAGFSMVAGWLADRFDKGRLLASGYFLAAVMALAMILLPANIWTLAAIFAIGGIYVAIEETLEDSFCAELVGEAHHGMAFGTLLGERRRRLRLEPDRRAPVDGLRNLCRLQLQRRVVPLRRRTGASCVRGSAT